MVVFVVCLVVPTVEFCFFPSLMSALTCAQACMPVPADLDNRSATLDIRQTMASIYFAMKYVYRV